MFTFVNEIQESLYSNFALAFFIHYFFAIGMKLPLNISQVMENRSYPEKKIIYSDNGADILQVAFYDFLYCDTT